MSKARAKELFDQCVPEPNQAISPVIWEIVILVLSKVAESCKTSGVKESDIAASVRSPTDVQRLRYARNLKKELGSKEYKNLGGMKFVRKVLTASSKLKVGESKKLVTEVLKG